MSEHRDYDYLLSFSFEQQRATANWRSDGGDPCRSCRHSWHGLSCTVTFPAMCLCPSSYEAAAS